MNYTILKSELENDPEGIGYTTPYERGNDVETARLLNLPRYEVYTLIPISDVQAYVMTETRADGKSVWMDINHKALTAEEPVKSLCSEIVSFFGARFQNVDFRIARVRGMVTSLYTAGIITEAQRDTLFDMGTTEISRAEQIFGTNVSTDDIVKARA